MRVGWSWRSPAAVYCEGLDAFLSARARHLIVSDDARGEREWLKR